MVTDIDALVERLADPEGVFTSEEVQSLIDWHVSNAYKDEYQRSRIADAMQQSAQVSDYAKAAMDALLSLWDPSPMVPTLQVVSDGQ